MANPKAIQQTIAAALGGLVSTSPAPTPASAAFNLQQFNERFEGIFEPFHTLGDPELETMKQDAREFCLGMASGGQPYWLTFLGAPGVGKTMACRLILKFFRKYLDGREDPARTNEDQIVRYRGEFYQWHQCIDWMVNDHSYSWIGNARSHFLAGFDDVGAESARFRELSASKLYDIQCAREQRWTLFTANLSLDQIVQAIDPRIASRLLRHGGVVRDLHLPDYNLPNHGR